MKWRNAGYNSMELGAWRFERRYSAAYWGQRQKVTYHLFRAGAYIRAFSRLSELRAHVAKAEASPSLQKDA